MSLNEASRHFLPINKWSINNVLEWLQRKVPNVHEAYASNFVENQITGETLLDLNEDCLDYLEIKDLKLRFLFTTRLFFLQI